MGKQGLWFSFFVIRGFRYFWNGILLSCQGFIVRMTHWITLVTCYVTFLRQANEGDFSIMNV